MEVFVFLIILLILLIIITIATTIIKLSLLVTTKYKYETYILIFPAILYLILWIGLFIAWLLLSDKYSDNGFINLIFDSIMKSNFNLLYFKNSIIIAIVCIIVGILIQPFIFLTVNFPYYKIRMALTKLFKNIKKWFIVKILKKDLKPELMPSYEMKIKEKWVKLKFVNALISSVFSFAVIFVITTLLILFSNMITKKILVKVQSDKPQDTEQVSQEDVPIENENNQ